MTHERPKRHQPARSLQLAGVLQLSTGDCPGGAAAPGWRTTTHGSLPPLPRLTRGLAVPYLRDFVGARGSGEGETGDLEASAARLLDALCPVCARDPRLLTMAEYVCTNMGRVVWGVRRGGDTALVRRQGESSSREPSQPTGITVWKLGGKSTGSPEGMGCSARDACGRVHGDGPDGS